MNLSISKKWGPSLFSETLSKKSWIQVEGHVDTATKYWLLVHPNLMKWGKNWFINGKQESKKHSTWEMPTKSCWVCCKYNLSRIKTLIIKVNTIFSNYQCQVNLHIHSFWFLYLYCFISISQTVSHIWLQSLLFLDHNQIPWSQTLDWD